MESELYRISNFENTKSSVCGCAMLSPGWCHMKRHLENESVLIFGRKNSALIDDEGTELEVKKNRLILLPAAHTHKGHEAIREDASYFWIHFYQRVEFENEVRYFIPEKILKEDAEVIYQSEFKNLRSSSDVSRISEKRRDNCIILPQIFDPENPASYSDVFFEILHEYEKPSFSSLYYNHLVMGLLLKIARDYSESCYRELENSGKRSSKIFSVVQKLMLNMENDLSNPNASLKFFADKMGMNADYLGRCFKKEMNVSIWHYLTRKRIELACLRLRETNSSVEQIAFDCGFSSKRQFYDDFRKFTGKTPASYRDESAYIGTNIL